MMNCKACGKYISYGEYCDRACMRAHICTLEAQLAEANEKARLQVALDRIEAAGWHMEKLRAYFDDGSLEYPYKPVCHITRLKRKIGPCDYRFFEAESLVAAAEIAAAWAEGQKEASDVG